MAYMEIANRIRSAAVNGDNSRATVDFIRENLQVSLKLPIIHIPLGKLAFAALCMLGEENKDDDEDVQYLIELLESERTGTV